MDIGEFGLIRELKKKIRPGKSVRLGVGDDAAVLPLSSKKDLLFTADMLIEDRHFRLGEATPFEIGRKALAVNLSDIAAMGGIPTHAVVSVGFPGHLTMNFVDELYKGMRELAKKFRVNIVGGDTNKSEKIIISLALLGEVEKGKWITRSGAKIGDMIFVTGDLGGSYVSKKHLNFVPRIKESQFLVNHFKIHSMMDLSDGLASDMHRICEASGVGAEIIEKKLPISRVAKSVQNALTDGEDFELLFTLSKKEATKLLSVGTSKIRGLAPFHAIGLIVEKRRGIILIKEGGKIVNLKEKGFDHFGCPHHLFPPIQRIGRHSAAKQVVG